MNKAEKGARDHREISDSITFLQGLLQAFGRGDSTDYSKKLHDFYDTYIIQHFRWEEKELFPSVLPHCNESEAAIVQELRKEHPTILKMISSFEDQVSSYGLESGAGGLIEITQTNSDLFDMILAHAKREEQELFPLLEKYGV